MQFIFFFRDTDSTQKNVTGKLRGKEREPSQIENINFSIFETSCEQPLPLPPPLNSRSGTEPLVHSLSMEDSIYYCIDENSYLQFL